MGMGLCCVERFTVPILGLPALQDFQVLVDCGAHELVDAKTGNTVRCSMVEAPKN